MSRFEKVAKPCDGYFTAEPAAMEDLIAAGVDLEFIVYDGADHVLPGVDFWPDVANWTEVGPFAR